MLMARRIHPAAKVFTLVLTIAFGLIALAVSYAAFKGGLELRSKAATPEAVVKAWDFQNSLEGWTANPYVGRMYVDNGRLIFGITSNTNPSVIEHAKLSDEFPQPHQMSLVMQFAIFPFVEDFLPTSTPTTSPVPTPVAIGSPVLGVETAPRLCAQVIMYARSETGECKAFATPCDVPSGWIADTSCTISVTPSGPYIPPFEPFSYSLQLSYRLRGKSTFEKPLSQSFTFTSGSGQEFTATFKLPLLNTPIEEIQIALSQGRVGSRVEVDWIHLTAPVLTPTPTVACKTGVNNFSVSIPCSGGYRSMTFSCYDGYGRTEGGPTSCKSSAVWSSYAKQYCEGRSNCPRTSIKPVPTSTPTPRPSPTPTPKGKRPEPTPTPKKSDWCKIMRLLPGGKSSAEFKKNCG